MTDARFLASAAVISIDDSACIDAPTIERLGVRDPCSTCHASRSIVECGAILRCQEMMSQRLGRVRGRGPVRSYDSLSAQVHDLDGIRISRRAVANPVVHACTRRSPTTRCDELGEALDVGIAELDRGQGIESSIDELMAEIDAAVGLDP